MMWFLKIFSFIRDAFFCRIEGIQIFPWTYSDEEFFRVILGSRGFVFRTYINGVKVPRRNSYVCGKYKDSETIKIRVRGILNSKTFLIPTDSTSHFVGFTINLPSVNKSESLRNKEIKYGKSRRNAVLDSKNIKSQKLNLAKKSKLHLSKKDSLEVLKSKRSFSLNRKNYHLNNLTNRPISWKN